MLATAIALVCLGTTVDNQRISATIDPASHAIRYTSSLSVDDIGSLVLDLSASVVIDEARCGNQTLTFHAAEARDGRRRISFDPTAAKGALVLTAHGRFEQDVAAGEKPGQIHNFSVDATIGPDGVFLSDGAAWCPRPLGADGRPLLHQIAIELTPVDGWAFVASGDPVGDGPLDKPCWSWTTKRPVDGLALVGNRHELHGLVHATSAGPVEIVMHVPNEHAAIADMYLSAATKYLDLYVPLLGAFPYRRFSIVENFFSSGFAYPGFTVLGPQVVGMAPRSLAPGYLDHELLHNWWGNGVYVDPSDGNWCEALTSYGANYWRRVADEGPEAGRGFRRDLLMKLSTDPATFDDGPLGQFGSANPAVPGPDRFVGYDKGAFVFFMLGDLLAKAAGRSDDARETVLWEALRRFAADRLGKPATWKDIQRACEAAVPDRPVGWLDGFFEHWVRSHPVPQTVVPNAKDAGEAFAAQFPRGSSVPPQVIMDERQTNIEIDPDFRLYRVLPAAQLVPTIAGSTGPGGLKVTSAETRGEVTSYMPQLQAVDSGENLLLIGRQAIADHGELLARCADPIAVDAEGFTLAGKRWSVPVNTVLHTMHHPDRPGRYITVFHANGEAGWSRLRMVRFYTRDTSIIWEGERVVERRVHEPDRRIPVVGPGAK
ncbi:MAG: hypothetical protein JNL80_04075 [Phycisphaerae bacterium]|nr:hypothetical protein [Phycisphaerae bacterium]